MKKPTIHIVSQLIIVASMMSCVHSAREGLWIDQELPATRLSNGIYTAAKPDSPAITLETLAENEQFWPHQVQLTEDWTPKGWEGDFAWGLGVLLRVDQRGRLRVDFSRHGKHWVPAQVTDVLARANAIREGRGHKYAPNLVLALGNRLLDPSDRELAESQVDLLSQRAFVVVFADPQEPSFATLSKNLADVESIQGIHVTLISQSDQSDAYVYKSCHEARWPGSFLLDRFARAYSEGFLEDKMDVPKIQILSPEGTLLWESSGRESVGSQVSEVLAEYL